MERERRDDAGESKEREMKRERLRVPD